MPPALAAAIDRCLARDPDGRFADGEALAAALAPPPEIRPTLPPTLRAWLGSSNPATFAYLGISGVFSVATVGNLVDIYQRGAFGNYNRLADVAVLLTLAMSPSIPLLGYHVNQARRLFRAGHTLNDLRTALGSRGSRAVRERSVEGGGRSRKRGLRELCVAHSIPRRHGVQSRCCSP